MGKIDHDAVLQARVLLLGSGRPSVGEQVAAYRVLLEVNRQAYAPKLVDALLAMGGRDPEVRLTLAVEAVEVARSIEAGTPSRAERLNRALGACQWALFALGRRAEGRAVCEEMRAAGRGGRLTTVLAEEGRFLEAAELNEEEAGHQTLKDSFGNLVEWAANLEGAGLHDEASAVFRTFLDTIRRFITERRVDRPLLACALVHHARMREAAGDGAEATAARREALTILEELAAGGAKGPGRTSSWLTLFVLSGRAGEPAASAGSPMPPFGTDVGWSGDVREAFVGGLPGLEAEAAVLREAGRLPELVDVQRRISVRVAVRDGDHTYRFVERYQPYFDEGVALARRLADDPGRLARALTDRAMFRTAAGDFGPAYADLAEAVTLLDAP
ncbi:hypothetical protein ACIQUQ_20425 [Streptomyces sp. NPDC101118]|uniref:hypothetical protein n=1 Tax=Streptomyces sp. NPDC101118 TaxID=3366109 RepID=UPI00382A8A3A